MKPAEAVLQAIVLGKATKAGDPRGGKGLEVGKISGWFTLLPFASVTCIAARALFMVVI